MNKTKAVPLGAALLWTIALFQTFSPAQGADLRYPSSQTNIIALGMGDALVADGTQFYAASFNPALLARSSHSVEALGLGLNIGNDIFGLIDYFNNFSFQPDTVYQNLVSISDSQVSSGLSSLDDVVNHLTDKAIQAGAQANISFRVGDHFGFQVYNSTHLYSTLSQGRLTQELTSIPLPYSSADSGAIITSADNILKSDVSTGIQQTLTPAQNGDATNQGYINSYENGSIDLPTFVADMENHNPGLDGDTLKGNILNSLFNDLAVLSALAYTDTVFMGTYALNPFDDIPGLTLGANLKIVNRHFAYTAINWNDNSLWTKFGNDLKQSTTRWGFDLGALYRIKEAQLDLGLSFVDLLHEGATIPQSAGSLLNGVVTDPAPTLVNLGASWHPVEGLTINGDIDDIFCDTSLYDNNDWASRFKFGVDYSLLGAIHFRGGIGDQALSGGFGFLAGFFGVDYAFASDDLSERYNHYLQLRFIF